MSVSNYARDARQLLEGSECQINAIMASSWLLRERVSNTEVLNFKDHISNGCEGIPHGRQVSVYNRFLKGDYRLEVCKVRQRTELIADEDRPLQIVAEDEAVLDSDSEPILPDSPRLYETKFDSDVVMHSEGEQESRHTSAAALPGSDPQPQHPTALPGSDPQPQHPTTLPGSDSQAQHPPAWTGSDPQPQDPIAADEDLQLALPTEVAAGVAQNVEGVTVNPDDIALDLVMTSSRWGQFRITPKKKQGLYIGYQASCPYHALNDKTGCKKTVGFSATATRAEQKLVLQGLLHWCIMGPEHTHQRHHRPLAIDYTALPPYPLLHSLRNQLPKPPAKVLNDDELDAMNAERSEALGASSSSMQPQRGQSSEQPSSPRWQCVSQVQLLSCPSSLDADHFPFSKTC
eukprot:6480569-Amphidinium_carterae.1